jgi:hypothetical protein
MSGETTAGAMWIDIEDKQVARLEAVLADNYKVGGLLMANLKKGAYFITEKERVGNEIWLPSSAELNISVKALLVAGFSANQIARYYDYQKFSTEVKDSKMDEIK